MNSAVCMTLMIVATGGWPERENVYSVRLSEIIDWYKCIVLVEKQQKMEKDKKKQRKYDLYCKYTTIIFNNLHLL